MRKTALSLALLALCACTPKSQDQTADDSAAQPADAAGLIGELGGEQVGHDVVRRMLGAPVHLGKAEIQPGQGTADADIGQRQMSASAAKRLLAQTLRHDLERGLDLAHLAVHPGLAALLCTAAGPGSQ